MGIHYDKCISGGVAKIHEKYYIAIYMAEETTFPGLDKHHGFFKAVEHNQISRDDYHKEQKIWQERRQQEVKHKKIEVRKIIIYIYIYIFIG